MAMYATLCIFLLTREKKFAIKRGWVHKKTSASSRGSGGNNGRKKVLRRVAWWRASRKRGDTSTGGVLRTPYAKQETLAEFIIIHGTHETWSCRLMLFNLLNFKIFPFIANAVYFLLQTRISEKRWYLESCLPNPWTMDSKKAVLVIF
jgi:hypothetical protein